MHQGWALEEFKLKKADHLPLLVNICVIPRGNSPFMIRNSMQSSTFGILEPPSHCLRVYTSFRP